MKNYCPILKNFLKCDFLFINTQNESKFLDFLNEKLPTKSFEIVTKDQLIVGNECYSEVSSGLSISNEKLAELLIERISLISTQNSSEKRPKIVVLNFPVDFGQFLALKRQFKMQLKRNFYWLLLF